MVSSAATNRQFRQPYCRHSAMKATHHVLLSLIFTALLVTSSARGQLTPDTANTASSLNPDIVVAADGTGDFTTVQEAVASIPRNNRERIVVLVKNGVYKEKVRVDASFLTLRGESRDGTGIEFPQLADDFKKNPDELGIGVVNVNGDDFVLENLTVKNTTGVIGPHEFAVYGKGDRTVIVDCDVLSEGADTVSLWLAERGRYYHARCNFRGAVDFVCPRGWCYVTDCSFYETKKTAAVWHDGHVDQDMKFVLRNCKFDGIKGWNLARHHHDAQFYFLDCTFAETMIDKPPFRVIYPNQPERNEVLDKTNIWGERAYYHNCRRDGGDYAWHADNLAAAPTSPTPEQITAKWTFAGRWDPKRRDPPTIQSVERQDGKIVVKFSENVTAKGKPRLALSDGEYAEYASGSGSDTLNFSTAAGSKAEVKSVELNGGAIIATEAGDSLRSADVTLPIRSASR